MGEPKTHRGGHGGAQVSTHVEPALSRLLCAGWRAGATSGVRTAHLERGAVSGHRVDLRDERDRRRGEASHRSEEATEEWNDILPSLIYTCTPTKNRRHHEQEPAARDRRVCCRHGGRGEDDR